MKKYFTLVDKNTKEIVSFITTTEKKYEDDRFLVIFTKKNLRGELHNYKYDEKTKQIVKFQDKSEPVRETFIKKDL